MLAIFSLWERERLGLSPRKWSINRFRGWGLGNPNVIQNQTSPDFRLREDSSSGNLNRHVGRLRFNLAVWNSESNGLVQLVRELSLAKDTMLCSQERH